jgi:hypothetical protein
MLTGPMQPEMGRLRVSDNIRRSEANRAAHTLARARGRERRGRMLGALGAIAAALRTRPVRAPRPVIAPPVPTVDC